MVAGLEAAVEVDEERVPGRDDHLKDPLLAHKTAEKNTSLSYYPQSCKEFFLSSSVITSMAAVPLMTTWGWLQKEVNSP